MSGSATPWAVVDTGEIEQAWDQSNARPTRLGYLLRCVGYLVMGAATLLGALTLMTVTDTFSGGPDAAATGSAQVRECTEMGPVSLAGLGYYYRCEADVSWEDGGSTRESFYPGQLSPDDRGEAVPVFSPNLPESGRRGGDLATEAGRNDSTKWFSIGVVSAMTLGLFGTLAMFFAAANVYSALRPATSRSARCSPARTSVRHCGGPRVVRCLGAIALGTTGRSPTPMRLRSLGSVARCGSGC